MVNDTAISRKSAQNFKMIEKDKPSCLIGPGRFQWNAGGWFGGAIGGSVVMLLIAGFLLRHGQTRLALIPAIAFASITVVATVYWCNRNRIYPFPAILGLFSWIAITIPIVVFSVDAFAQPAALAAMNWPTSLPLKIVACLTVPYTVWKMSIQESKVVQQNTQRENME